MFATVNANGTLAVAIVCADMIGTLTNRDNVTIARIPKTLHFIVFSLEIPSARNLACCLCIVPWGVVRTSRHTLL